MHEIDEMLETGVQVGFSTQTHNFLEVAVVYVCIDAEQTFENDFYNRLEVLWERCT